MKIGIIGSNWYSGHTARVLTKEGNDVTILEAGPHIFANVSAMFDIRNNIGPLYQKSPKSRENSRLAVKEFDALYPELIIQHYYSIFALGTHDSSGLESKITPQEFRAACEEVSGCRQIGVQHWGFNEKQIPIAFDIHESSIAVGKRLRQKWEEYLKEDNIKIRCNYRVKKIERRDGKVIVNDELEFDALVNATRFQSFTPQKPFPFNIGIKYQVCLALLYQDTKSTTAPFSVTFFDGNSLSFIPYDDRIEGEEHLDRNYAMTHSKWTIMCSADTPEEAREVFNKITNSFIERKIKPRCESDMVRFWPKFSERFKYKGWQWDISPKIRSNEELAMTFEYNGVIHIVPSAVNNVVYAAREVLALLKNEHVLTNGNFHYVQGGILDKAIHEIREKPIDVRSTFNQRTYEELKVLPEMAPQPERFRLVRNASF